jgi:hypothetical protein
MLWAVFSRPVVVIPAGLWERLGDEQRDTLLLHELVHLRRFDHWIRRLELVVIALYWWHPVVWWARRQLEQAEEQCCDAWVVSTLPSAATSYAQTLVATVAFLSQNPAKLVLGASGIGQMVLLKRRLTMIMRTNPPKTLSRLGAVIVLALGMGLLPLAPSWGRHSVQHDSGDPAPAQSPADPQPRSRTDQTPPAPPRVDQPPDKAATPSTPRPGSGRPHAKPPDPADDIRDEIAVLESQVEGKQAEVQEAKARLAQNKLELDRLNRLKLKGVVAEEELARARSEQDILTARLVGKEAQLREAEIRVRQARRRLTAPQGEARPGQGAILVEESVKDFGVVKRGAILNHCFVLTNRTAAPIRIANIHTSNSHVTASSPEEAVIAPGKSTGILATMNTAALSGSKTVALYVEFDPPSPASIVLKLHADSREAAQPPPVRNQARLKDLEKKLDDLRKEIESLRRDVRPPQSANTPRLLEPGLFEINARSFLIPFRLSPDQHKSVKQLLLFCSTDAGRSWDQVAAANPAEQQFVYQAPDDGEYWFQVCTVDAEGNRELRDFNQAPVGLKVRVRSSSPGS